MVAKSKSFGGEEGRPARRSLGEAWEGSPKTLWV